MEPKDGSPPFTEPAWRRRELAELLMRHILEWARDQRLDRLVLHASAEGRGLYERLGFVATNEMRFNGSLTPRTGGFQVETRRLDFPLSSHRDQA